MMPRWVVDTNVPIVANGRDDDPSHPVTDSCREETIRFLTDLLESGTVLMDSADEIKEEYLKKLNTSGEPGVGDRFCYSILLRVDKVERIDLPKTTDPKTADEVFDDLPPAIAASGFHSKDRKFAALSVKEKVPVVNATDTDWADHKTVLEQNGVQIEFLCGCDPDAWWE